MKACGAEARKASGWYAVSDISQDQRDVTTSTTEAGCNRHSFGGPGDTNRSRHKAVGPASPLLERDRQDRPCICSVAGLAEQDDGLVVVFAAATSVPQPSNAHLQ